MTVVRYGEKAFEVEERQSVLLTLTRHGVAVPYSCGNGVCQTCLMRAVNGKPPKASQQGLKDSLVVQNYFLACSCFPEGDLEVALPDDAGKPWQATVQTLRRLNHDIMLVGLLADEGFDYRPGQFITLYQSRHLSRSYSIASVPPVDGQIHLHVRRLPSGKMSAWVHDTLETGQTVEFQGPFGSCFYLPGRTEQDLLLIGTGSGLAPLYGILRDALQQGHSGQIRLYHGSRDRHGLYLAQELRELQRQHPNFQYTPCLSGPDVPEAYAAGRADDVAFGDLPSLKNWRVYLCGHPQMVTAAKKRAFLAGASMKEIYSDAFYTNNAIHQPS